MQHGLSLAERDVKILDVRDKNPEFTALCEKYPEIGVFFDEYENSIGINHDWVYLEEHSLSPVIIKVGEAIEFFTPFLREGEWIVPTSFVALPISKYWAMRRFQVSNRAGKITNHVYFSRHINIPAWYDNCIDQYTFPLNTMH